MSEPDLNDIDHDLIVALRQRIAELEAEVARLNKAMDPIDQECCQLQDKWKREAQWAARIIAELYSYILEMHATVCGSDAKSPMREQVRLDTERAKRILDGML